MRAAILSRLIPWSISHEGYWPFPYCDGLNLVTVGIGNLMNVPCSLREIWYMDAVRVLSHVRRAAGVRRAARWTAACELEFMRDWLDPRVAVKLGDVIGFTPFVRRLHEAPYAAAVRFAAWELSQGVFVGTAVLDAIEGFYEDDPAGVAFLCALSDVTACASSQ